ncbi:MAG: METTL5 family protein [Candidatus Nanoarchaeia archaeon]|nr:METTL5 family protein [Candidatus Nanoarchaeia archaeon]
MQKIKNKKDLEIILSKLKTFENPDISLEQYQTNSEIAARILWEAYMNGDIKNKVIGDFGCGNGILGFGCLLLEAKKVYLVDKDKEAIKTAKENKKRLKDFKLNCVFVNKDINDFNERVDVVIENPPFGTKTKHIDKEFLSRAMKLSKIIYSFHKSTSGTFVDAFSRDNKFRISSVYCVKFPLKKMFGFHRKNSYFVDVCVWKLVKETL